MLLRDVHQIEWITEHQITWKEDIEGGTISQCMQYFSSHSPPSLHISKPLPLHLLKCEEERNLATYKVNARISSANVFNLKIAGFQERKETCVRIFLIWCNFFDDQTAKENDQTSYRFTDPKTVLMMIASLIKKFKA